MAATTGVEVNVRSEVRRGAALLDAYEPGWDERIDITRLDIGYCDKCIVGQLFESHGSWSYYDALRTLGIDGDDERYGFDSHTESDDDTAKLTEEWRDLIASRR